MTTAVPDDSVDRRAARVRLVVLDVDGVLTDGGLFYSGEGETLKRFDVRDGLGIKLLGHAGIEVAVISARASEALRRRVLDLGIAHFRAGCRDKRTALDALARELGLGLDAVCFVGDDLLDRSVLESVGFAVAVADANAAAKAAAHWVTEAGGGRGAVREVADRLLAARGVLERVSEEWLEAQAHAAEPPFGVIIPARYASTRLPGKPLLDLGGKPMIVRVLENVARSGAAFVVVATDDTRIAEAVIDAGGEAVLTSPGHVSGTDRLAEVVQKRALAPETLVVNVQGDEPLLDPELVSKVATNLGRHADAGMATLATPFAPRDDAMNPNAVKVVTDARGMALYFSRAPIPFSRDGAAPRGTMFRHVGIYAYRARTLGRLASTPPPDIEQLESLEQLRALWLGIRIHVDVIQEMPAHGVDTEEDLARVREAFRGR